MDMVVVDLQAFQLGKGIESFVVKELAIVNIPTRHLRITSSNPHLKFKPKSSENVSLLGKQIFKITLGQWIREFG